MSIWCERKNGGISPWPSGICQGICEERNSGAFDVKERVRKSCGLYHVWHFLDVHLLLKLLFIRSKLGQHINRLAIISSGYDELSSCSRFVC